MADPSKPASSEKPPAPVTSYRGLVIFWTIVIALLGGGGAALQMLGPPSHGAATQFVLPADHASASGPHAIPGTDAALEEPAPDFPGRNLPIIGAGNRAPAIVYAAAFDANDKHPRVALIISGAGLDQDQTLHLLRDLPAAVDVAFSPYMPEALEDQFAATARKTGHECLQSIPMEPSGYPLTEEGARELLTGADGEQNRQDLEWALSRMPGCIGATGASDGMMGERFAQTGEGFADVLGETSKRGLLYLDPRTGAPALANASIQNVRVADMAVDQSPNPEQPVTADMIDQRLAALERLATERGKAIGLAGPPKPVMLERIAVWANGLAARGVTLVPLTAIPGPPPPPSDDN
jgi:polysaccharide deacetylase 2 family uncharacterized protein YibQ